MSLLMEKNCKYGTQSSEDGLHKFKARLSKVTSEGQWASLWHTAGSSMALRRSERGRIMVQPTSLARRKRLIAGCRAHNIGRPPKNSKNKNAVGASKKKHKLSLLYNK